MTDAVRRPVDCLVLVCKHVDGNARLDAEDRQAKCKQVTQ